MSNRTYEKSPTIDGTFFRIGNTWSDAGAGATAMAVSTTFTADSTFIQSIDISDSNTTQIERGAIEFDTSDITETPTSATIKLHGHSTSSPHIRIIGVEASFATDGAIVTGDWDSWNEASPVNYTDILGISASIGSTDWNDDSYNTFTLTAAAKAAMVSQDVIQIIWLEYDNDYDRTSSGGTFGSHVDIKLGACGRNNTDASKRPVLTYTLPPLPGKLNISGGNLNLKGGSFTIK